MKPELDCDSFELKINELLDNRESLRNVAVLQEHASRCADCNLLLNDFLAVHSVFSDRRAVIEDLCHSPVRPIASQRRHNGWHPFEKKKVVWSLGPCFVALLMVGICISISPQNVASVNQFGKLLQHDIQNRPSPIGIANSIPNPTDFAALESSILWERMASHTDRIDDRAKNQPAASSNGTAQWKNCIFSDVWQSYPSTSYPLFELAYNVPQLTETRSFHKIKSLDQILGQAMPLEAILYQTPNRYVFLPARGSLEMTFDWLQRSLRKTNRNNSEFLPDVGQKSEYLIASLA